MLRHWWVRVLVFVAISQALRIFAGANGVKISPSYWFMLGGVGLAVIAVLVAVWYYRRHDIGPALMEDDLVLVETALRNGANPNRTFNLPSKLPRKRRDGQFTGLHIAAINNDLEAARLLLNWGADPNRRTRFRSTPLFFAAYKEHWDMVRLLLECAADPNLLPESGRSPLMLAARAGEIPIINLLILHKAQLDAVIPSGEPEAGFTALHYAVLAEQLPAIDILLNAGANPAIPEVKGCTPAMLAVLNDKRRALLALLDHGVDPNHSPGTNVPSLVELAYEHAGRGMVDLLLSRGARDVPRSGRNGRSLLHHAAVEGDVILARSLLEGGMSPNAPDERGLTPLHCAATCGNQQRYALVTEGKGYPEPGGDLTQTREARIVRLLLEHGARCDARDEEGDTPLHLAAHFENPAAVRALLDGGADVNARNKDDMTPLHEANVHASIASMRLLLAAGADPNARGTYGRQPLDLLLYNADRLDKKLLQKASRMMLAAGAKHSAAPGWVEEGKYGQQG